MIDTYLNLIQEGYIFSDKTISVDLKKFEDGESDKLLIFGLIGSGKTTLGMHLSKKYNTELKSTDKCLQWEPGGPSPNEKQLKHYYQCIANRIISKDRCIIEGVGLFGFSKRDWILKHPMILIGKSALASTIKAFTRKRESPIHVLFKQTKMNFLRAQKQLDEIRRKRTSIEGAIVKEYKIPKL